MLRASRLFRFPSPGSLAFGFCGRRPACRCLAGLLLVGAFVLASPALGQETATPATDAREAGAEDAASRQTAAREPASPARGQFVESLDVRVVNVDVFVTNRQGEPISGLRQEDFRLQVDGEPMPISNFYVEERGRVRETVRATGRPIEARGDREFVPLEEVATDPNRRASVVIFVDHTRLRTVNRKRAFDALRQAIRQFDDDDLVAVVGLENRLVFYSDFLYDRRAIGEILDEVEDVAGQTDVAGIERRRIFGELARGQSGGFLGRNANIDGPQLIARIRAFAATEYDRSVRTLRELERVVSTVAGVPGRTALLYVGEGIPTRPGEGLYVEWRNRFGEGNPSAEAGLRRFDFDTDYTRAVGRYDLLTLMEKLAERANQAGVTLYALDAEPDHAGEVRSAATEQGATSETLSVVAESFREPLEFATRATGGRLIQATGRLALELEEMTRDFGTFYSLGFVQPDWPPGSEHSIEVKVAGRRQLVRHREQVRVPLPDEVEASATVAALLYQAQHNPLQVVATPGSEAPRDDGKAALPVRLEIPIDGLAFLPSDGQMAAALDIYVSIEDAEGNPGKVQKIPFHLKMPADVLRQAQGESAHYTLPLVLDPGDQQVAIGVRDQVGGAMSTVRLDVARFSRSF